MNDNTKPTEIVSYSFTLSFKVGGLVDSNLDKDITLAKLTEELTDFYGPEGFDIVDFRVATEDEQELYRKYLADELTSEASESTIN